MTKQADNKKARVEEYLFNKISWEKLCRDVYGVEVRILLEILKELQFMNTKNL